MGKPIEQARPLPFQNFKNFRSRPATPRNLFQAAVAARFEEVHGDRTKRAVFKYGKRWLIRVPVEIARGLWRHSAKTRQTYGRSVPHQFWDLCRLYVSQGIPVQDYYSGGLATLSKQQLEQFVPFWMYRDAVLFCMPVEQTHEDVVRINSKSKLAAQVKAEGYSAPKTLALFDPADDEDQPPIQRSFFAKPDLGGMGIHAQRWLLRDLVFFQEEDNLAIPENEISSHLKEKCRRIGKTLLVQELMENSTTMRAWAGNTLATARIDTCRTPDGDITIGRAILRMPSATTSSVDNLHSGGTGFHIDPISGTIGMGNALDGFGPADYSRTSPATGETVTGHTVPDWAEMVAMVKHLHANLSDLPIIGWDVGHTTGGPTVVEANVPAGIGVTVLYKMGGFFASPLGECLTKCIEARLKETQPKGSRLIVGAEHANDRYNGE